MEAAKAAISKLTSNQGHHTTVEESVNPAITRETVKPHRHEEATQAIDREVHQHHHHTTALPLSHTETLPEKHTHNLLPTEHREFHHDDEAGTKQRLATELGHFKDSSTTEKTHHTHVSAPAVTGEHVHHHVHETVVPVIHKETIQPEVVHTTVPIHETHHAAAQHHGLSALPMKTLDEFKKAGGVLTGGKHSTHEEYEGAPRPYNDKLSTTLEKLGFKEDGNATAAEARHRHTDSGVGGVDNDIARGEAAAGKDVGDNTLSSGGGGIGHTAGGGNDIGRDNVAGKDIHSGNNPASFGTGDVSNKPTAGSGLTGATGTGDTRGIDTTKTTTSTTDRLNPLKDSDRDGKAGVLS